jgi:hypothetical protein
VPRAVPWTLENSFRPSLNSSVWSFDNLTHISVRRSLTKELESFLVIFNRVPILVNAWDFWEIVVRHSFYRRLMFFYRSLLVVLIQHPLHLGIRLGHRKSLPTRFRRTRVYQTNALPHEYIDELDK